MLWDKSRSLDKSRSSQRTETEDIVKTINKSGSIWSAIFYDKITNIEQPKEIDIRKDSQSISGMYGPGASVTTKFPDKQRITCRDKKKLWKNLSKEKKLFKIQTTRVKGKNRIVYLMKKKTIKKHLHYLKIRKTTLVKLTRRHVNTLILQVKLIVVWGTWAKNIKTKKTNNTVKLILK